MGVLEMATMLDFIFTTSIAMRFPLSISAQREVTGAKQKNTRCQCFEFRLLLTFLES